jgi:DNA-directed RNA polymerase subunit RPC12/RpoP
LIAEQVTDRAEHRRRLCDPDGYRPAECPRCHHPVLHVHDHLDRILAADSEQASIEIVRYRCAACEATWRILPAFVARQLWRSWDTVKANTLSAPAPKTLPPVPERTQRRWRTRWRASAVVLLRDVRGLHRARPEGRAQVLQELARPRHGPVHCQLDALSRRIHRR